MELIKEIFDLVIYTVITGVGVTVVFKITEFINAKVDNIQKTTKLAEYEKLNLIIDQVQSAMTTIVQSVNQVFVNDLKASGEFNKETATEAKNKALEMAKELITEESATAIEQVYGNVDIYLENLVEFIVSELKK